MEVQDCKVWSAVGELTTSLTQDAIYIHDPSILPSLVSEKYVFGHLLIEDMHPRLFHVLHSDVLARKDTVVANGNVHIFLICSDCKKHSSISGRLKLFKSYGSYIPTPFYRLPTLQYLLLTLSSDIDCPNGTVIVKLLSLGRLHRMIQEQVVTFGDWTSHIQHYVSPSVSISFSISWYDIIERQSHVKDNCGRIGQHTQIILMSQIVGYRMRCYCCDLHRVQDFNIQCKPMCDVCQHSLSFLDKQRPGQWDDVWNIHDHQILAKCWSVFENFVRNDSMTPFSSTNSLLLLGESGSGLSSIADAMAWRKKFSLIEITSSLLFSSPNGMKPAQILKRAFRQAIAMQPCIVLIDDMNYIFPQTIHSESETLRDEFAQLASVSILID